VCDSFEALERVFERVTERHGPAVVQEYVPNGGERGVYAMYDYGSDCRAATVQKRLRSCPPEGGPSCFRKTVSDPELLDLADRLLSSIGWRGPAMVEFRIDPRDGEPKLMEINPRLWGSLALSVAAGVDFPYLLYQLGAEGRCDDVPGYETGVYARHLAGEIGYVASSEDELVALREVLRAAPGPCSFDLLSREDPVPALRYLSQTVGDTVRGAIGS
jgi:predicted ATP-grasp superfamily ATP-dependent carboligase